MDRFVVNREKLGDLDENMWPYDTNGKQSDPWAHTVYIPFVTPDGGTLYTFSTHSFYGRDAAYRLLKAYGDEARQHPGCYPVVRIGTASNPTKKYGDVDGPTLQIVDWQDKPTQVLALTSLPELDHERPPPKPTRSKSSFGDRNTDMDDDIPF